MRSSLFGDSVRYIGATIITSNVMLNANFLFWFLRQYQSALALLHCRNIHTTTLAMQAR